MSDTWNEIWVYGLRAPLEAWIETKKVDTIDGNRVLPEGVLVTSPCYEMEQTGVDDDGNPVYEAKTKASDKCVWMFSLNGDKQVLIDEVKVLNGPFVVHENTTIESVRQIYPNHWPIPHLARGL